MPTVAGRGHLRASHADREHVIDVLKGAFVAGRLTKDELEARVGHTLAARTFADLAALTADIPAGLPTARPPRTAAGPRVRTAVKFGVCLAVGPAVLVGAYFTKSDSLAKELFTFVIIYYMILMVTGVMVLDSWHQKRYRGQPPPRPVRRDHAPGSGPDGRRDDGLTRSELRSKARARRPLDRSLTHRSRHIPAVRNERGWSANLQATG
jgi:hypothetical protein